MQSLKYTLPAYCQLLSLFVVWLVKCLMLSVTADLPCNRSQIEERLKKANIIPDFFERAPKFVVEVI